MEKKGLYGKFFIEKADGTPIDKEAKYIVLRYDAPGHAIERMALNVLAIHLEKAGHNEFARDLVEALSVERRKALVSR